MLVWVTIRIIEFIPPKVERILRKGSTSWGETAPNFISKCYRRRDSILSDQFSIIRGLNIKTTNNGKLQEKTYRDITVLNPTQVYGHNCAKALGITLLKELCKITL